MKRLMGGILLAIGILIMGASGLCSAVFLIEGIGQPDSLEFLPVVLIFAGVPFLAGLALLFGGRALLRSARLDDDQP